MCVYIYLSTLASTVLLYSRLERTLLRNNYNDNVKYEMIEQKFRLRCSHRKHWIINTNFQFKTYTKNATDTIFKKNIALL